MQCKYNINTIYSIQCKLLDITEITYNNIILKYQA